MLVFSVRRKSSRGEKGASIVEVLVALLILSGALMGFLSLHQNSLALTQEAFWLNEASAIASNLSERLKANPQMFADYRKSVLWGLQEVGQGIACHQRVCTPTQLVEADIVEIKQIVAQQLPQGEIAIQPCWTFSSGDSIKADQVSDCIALAWAGTALSGCVSSDGAASQATCIQVGVSHAVP